MSSTIRSVLLCYGCALVSVALAIWARLLLDPALGNQLPFLTVFFAILLTAWYGGFRPALTAAILGGLSANYFIMPPRGSFALVGSEQRVGMILYCVTSLGIAMLGGLMHAARRRAEVSANGERRQAALIDQTHDAVLVWEWNGPILFWNRGAERLYGFPSAEAVGRLSYELLHTSTPGGVAGFIAALERQGSWEGELEHTTRAGGRIIVETRMVLVRQAAPPYVLEANRDITERRRMEDDLREVNERFRLLVEDVADYAIFMLDLGGHVLTWNLGAERLKGYQARDIVGHHFSRFYVDEDLASGKPERELRQAMAEGRCEDVGWRVRKDGSRFWARVVITTLRDDTGQPCGFTKITRDITESKRAEERFRQAVESAPNGMVMIDAAGRIILVNAQTERLFGYTRDEMLGQPIEMLVPERFRNRHPEYRASFFAQPQVRPMGVGRDLYGQRKNGSEFPVEIGLNPINTEQGLLVLSAIVDITERKRAEDALKETEARLNLFFTHAPAALAMFDRDMRYLAVSRRWLYDYGLGDRTIIGRLHSEIFPEVPERWKAIHRRGLEGEVVRVDAERFDRADGSVQWLRWEMRPWPAANGTVGGILLFTEDITERKQTEEAVGQLNETLEQRVIERTSQLEAANKELEAFSYSVSHDLRAPLRAIDGFSRILLKHHASHLTEDGRVFLEDIRANTLQMGRLVDDLLAFSRLSRQPVKKQTVDTAQVVRPCLDELEEARQGRQVEVCLGELPPCQADPALLKQVWFNLLANALKYTGKKAAAVIEVGCRCDDGRPVYFVKDNGVGFDMLYAHKLFGVFQRLHRSEDYEGTGVGLAIVQRIIQRHGGQIWAEAQVDRGATFFFTLDSGEPLHA